MTMFKELYALASAATLTMILSADEKTGRLTVSVLPKPKKDMGEPALVDGAVPAGDRAADVRVAGQQQP